MSQVLQMPWSHVCYCALLFPRLTPYHRLRKLLKQNSYLHWPEEPNAEDMFWTQLREALDAGGSTNKLHQFNVIE